MAHTTEEDARLSVVEEFISLDGEGPTAGALSYFVRFAGCSLRCAWCDTAYSWDGSAAPVTRTARAIYADIASSGLTHVTLTGGEPLEQPHILPLLRLLARDASRGVHIETNGAVEIAPFRAACPAGNIAFVVDYKLPSSGMEARMCPANLEQVERRDAYKFVIASQADLDRALEVLARSDLTERCQVFFSPVRECIDPLRIVETMRACRLNKVRLQLQLHKILWPDTARGV